MVSFKCAALFFLCTLAPGTAASIRAHRRLSFESIANYGPRSQVTDHNAIDMDQEQLEMQLSFGTNDSFEKGLKIYTDGGFSKSVAMISLTSPLLGPLNAGDAVTGKATDGSDVAGKVFDDYSTGDVVIGIQYQTSDIQSSYVKCQVGGNPNPNTEGCLAASGTISVAAIGSFDYNYSVLENNVNERTLQGFSLQAEDKMYNCENCPYLTYEKFYQYYGRHDYADHWIVSAFNGEKTSFANGNADFRGYGFTGRSEAIKKGTAYMSVWMYVIREMEDALDDCKSECDIENCNDDPVHAWDEAVAFYSGSLEGIDGRGSGKLLHQLADKRCANFRTCGDLADETNGLSHVNIEIFRQFAAGLQDLLSGECSALRSKKERIEQLMAVPLVQGTLRYAYVTEFEPDAGEKEEAEGAVFAAAVLPLVNACDSDAADTIWSNMQTGQDGSASFKTVKRSFESVYSCMKIRCADVGGLYDAASRKYLPHASPCGVQSSSGSQAGVIVGSIIGGVVGLALIVFMMIRCSAGSHSVAGGPQSDAVVT